jgi:hypothetical protein
MELIRFRANKRKLSVKDASNSLATTMPEELAGLLRAEREAAEEVPVPKSPKPHRLVESWPKPQKPSYGLPWFTNEGESRRRRIASVLFREVERRGGSVSPNKERKDDTHRFGVASFGETIEVTFRERLKMVKIQQILSGFTVMKRRNISRQVCYSFGSRIILTTGSGVNGTIP